MWRQTRAAASFVREIHAHCDQTPAGDAEHAGEDGEPRALLVGWGNGTTGENTAWHFPTKGNVHLLCDPALLLPDTY